MRRTRDVAWICVVNKNKLAAYIHFDLVFFVTRVSKTLDHFEQELTVVCATKKGMTRE